MSLIKKFQSLFVSKDKLDWLMFDASGGTKLHRDLSLHGGENVPQQVIDQLSDDDLMLLAHRSVLEDRDTYESTLGEWVGHISLYDPRFSRIKATRRSKNGKEQAFSISPAWIKRFEQASPAVWLQSQKKMTGELRPLEDILENCTVEGHFLPDFIDLKPIIAQLTRDDVMLPILDRFNWSLQGAPVIMLFVEGKALSLLSDNVFQAMTAKDWTNPVAMGRKGIMGEIIEHGQFDDVLLRESLWYGHLNALVTMWKSVPDAEKTPERAKKYDLILRLVSIRQAKESQADQRVIKL